MPLVSIRFGTPEKVTSAEGVNYNKYSCLAEALVHRVSPQSTIDKKEVTAILKLAQSDRESELIRYCIFKALRLSSTVARKSLGLKKCMKTDPSLSKQHLKKLVSLEKLLRTWHLYKMKVFTVTGYLSICMLVSTSDSESETDCPCDDPSDFMESPPTSGSFEDGVAISGDKVDDDAAMLSVLED